MIRKISLISLCVVFLLLSACSSTPKEAQYIGDRSVQYNEAKKGWDVFWAFYLTENDNDGVAQEADINVEIVNDQGDSIYKKTTHVTESDYSKWTYNLTNQEKLLGNIFIPNSNITKGVETTGQLKLSATLPSGGGFDPVDLYIYNLPLMDLSVSAPDLPIVINNYDYYGNVDTTAEITKLNFIYEYSASAEIVLTMTYNKDGDTEDDYFQVPYKVKDADGIIVDSGTFFCGPLSVGDTIKESTYFMNVKLGTDYTIEFSDNKY